MTEDYDKVDGAIEVILRTMVGERVMRPEFGCNLMQVVFQPVEIATTIGAQEIERALRIFEPRINVEGISVSVPNETEVIFDIDYTLRAEQERRNKKVIFRKIEYPTT